MATWGSLPCLVKVTFQLFFSMVFYSLVLHRMSASVMKSEQHIVLLSLQSRLIDASAKLPQVPAHALTMATILLNRHPPNSLINVMDPLLRGRDGLTDFYICSGFFFSGAHSLFMFPWKFPQVSTGLQPICVGV